MNRAELRRRIAAITYRSLYWARHHVAPGVRSLLGLLLMSGGVLGFLPILGFWMFPLGIAFVALDIPATRHHIELWMVRLAHEAHCGSDLLVANPPRSGSDLLVAKPQPVRGREAAPTEPIPTEPVPTEAVDQPTSSQ